MKTIFFLILALPLLILPLGCQKDEISPDSGYYTGNSTALKNGESWNSVAHIAYNTFTVAQTVDIALLTYIDGVPRLAVSFTEIPTHQGHFLLFNSFTQVDDGLVGASLVTLSYDGDVVEDRYLVLEDSLQSHVTLTEIDQQTGWYRGSFRAIFYLDPNRPKFNPANPDTIRFEQGRFEVQLRE